MAAKLSLMYIVSSKKLVAHKNAERAFVVSLKKKILASSRKYGTMLNFGDLFNSMGY